MAAAKNKELNNYAQEIRVYFQHMRGAFIQKEVQIPDEVRDLHKEVHSDLPMRSSEWDNQNLRNDMHNIRLDLRKALEELKLEFDNG